MLPEDQIEQIKKQLIQQIESTFPDDKKQAAIDQINSMNTEQLEEFLKQNNLIKDGESPGTQQCIFCSIVSGQTSSYKIDENQDAIAILEINPISKAHTIIIPKEHIKSQDKLPPTIFQLADKIAAKIKDKYKPKDVIISSANLFGHEIVNVLPVYENETLESPKQQAKPEDLLAMQGELETKPEPQKVEAPKIEKLDSEKLWLPKRIP